jgi:hypothetical protein
VRFYRFCPSVFLYLASVGPSIWLIELDKLDTRLAMKESLELQSTDLTSLTETTSVPSTSTMLPIMINTSIFGTDNSSSSKVDLGVLKDVGVSLRHDRVISILARGE